MPLGASPPIFAYCGAISALPGDVLLWLQWCDFRTADPLFIDYSGAKYARSAPKIAVAKNHFFGELKTANFSTACGRVTLKSPPSRGSDAPHVHSRLRKHLSRCTLDCGFKTPESPALRGFVAERGPIRGTSLYLVLKSNGLPRPKIRLKKFGFSSKSVPANIAKKLPLQRCPQPLLIPIFNFSHKWPTFAFTGESGYTLGFRRRIAHSGLHAETGGVSDGGGITTLGAFRTFTNIPGPGIRTASFAAFGSWSETLLKNAESLRSSDALMRVAVPRRRGPAGLRDLFRFCRNCGLYALRSGPFRVCEARGGITTFSALYVLLKRRTAACQNGSFAVF